MSEAAADAVCQVKVTGPGIQAEKEVSLPIAMAVMQVMFGGALGSTSELLDPGAGRPVSGTGASQLGRKQRLSVREFLEEVGGSSFPEKIAVIGRYMRDHEGQQDFSREDTKVRFRLASEAMPGNLPRDFQKAVQFGWIAEDPDNRDRFYVTRRGDEAIDRKFDAVSTPKIRVKQRRRSSASAETSNHNEE